MTIQRVVLSIALLIILVGFYNTALAHRVNLFCYFEDGFLLGEGYYSRGKPAQNAAIALYSLEGNTLVAETQTDADGKFKVQMASPDSVKVVMNAGGGHRCECIVEQESTMPFEERDLTRDQQQSEPRAISIIAGIGVIIGMFSLLHVIRRNHAA